jgi:hypothetical protein
MTDIIERIRSRPNDAPMSAERLLDEAANVIEGLRAALQHASAHLSDLEYHWHGDSEAMWKPIRDARALGQTT